MIPQSAFDQVDVPRVCEELGITFSRSFGPNWQACCPLHEDRTPSWTIAVEGDKKGLWRCWGACNRGGTIFSLYASLKGITTEAAVRHLTLGTRPDVEIEELIARLMAFDKPVEPPLRVPLPPLLTQDVARPQIERYLAGRKVPIDPRVIEPFELGIAASGQYAGSVIVPLHEPDGSLVRCYQAIATVPSDKPKRFPFGSRVEDLVFNLHRVVRKGLRWAFLVESPTDAMQMEAHDLPVVSTLSARMAESQARSLVAHLDRVFIAYDPDPAGREATTRAIDLLVPYTKCYVVKLPEGMDPGDLRSTHVRQLKSWTYAVE